MPTTKKKQKKARKSRGLELLPIIENLEILLGEKRSERDESVNSNSARRLENTTSEMFEENEENLDLNHSEMRPGNSNNPGQNSTSANSNAEISRLSIELNSSLSREMDEVMNSVNTQFQRAISDAISNQILSHLQNAPRAGSWHVTQNRWNVLAERPENNLKDYRSEKTKNYSRSHSTRDCLQDNHTNQG